MIHHRHHHRTIIAPFSSSSASFRSSSKAAPHSHYRIYERTGMTTSISTPTPESPHRSQQEEPERALVVVRAH